MINKSKNLTSAWDYTSQAKFYDRRPNYSPKAINHLCQYVRTKKVKGYIVADIGAGTGNLTTLLSDKVGSIIAIEPTDAMKEIGMEKTKHLNNVKWITGTGENTTLPSNSVDLVTFGSSFNTTDRMKSLQEDYRILKPKGFFACMWNNRDLTIPTQKKVEEIIQNHYPGYSHGVRREQQADIIIGSGLFDYLHYFEVPQDIEMNIDDFCDAWRSVRNQFWDLSNTKARAKLDKMITDIKNEFKNLKNLNIVYVTKVWVAKKKKENGKF